MPSEGDERRHWPRMELRLVTLSRIGPLIQGRGYTRNISRKGLAVVLHNAFRLLTPARIQRLVGMPVKLVIADRSITIHGTIVRVDSTQEEAAVEVVEVNDPEAWEKICEFLD